MYKLSRLFARQSKSVFSKMPLYEKSCCRMGLNPENQNGRHFILILQTAGILASTFVCRRGASTSNTNGTGGHRPGASERPMLETFILFLFTNFRHSYPSY